MKRVICCLAIFCLAVWLCSCAHTGQTEAKPWIWGWWPNGTQWKDSTLNALRSPRTLVPLAGAALVWATGWDEQISDWAIDNKPIFGSTDTADNASDTLVTACQIAMVGSALAVPGGESPWKTKAGRLAVGYGSMYVADFLTASGKDYFDRERPIGGGHGFPSRHSTLAFSYMTSASRNFDAIEINRYARQAAQWGLTAMATGAAWARVESGRHYPTDILVGAFVGTFVSAVINDAFFGKYSQIQVAAEVDPQEGLSLIVRLEF